MLVIPAIDLLDGQVVRLQKGAYDQVTVYNDDPLDEARTFRGGGFGHIHIVDLNGARDGTFTNLQHIRAIKEITGLSIQTGGGIRSYDDARKLLEAGIDQVVCSSMAVKKPDEWLRLVGDYPERMILGMDLKDGQIAYGGWLQTAETSVDDFLKPMMERGLRYVLSTDIARDGMMQGANLGLYRSLQERYPELNFIASGGVAGQDDLKALHEAGLYGVVVGRAYYEEAISLEGMQQYHEQP